jgi:hypothetical protein
MATFIINDVEGRGKPDLKNGQVAEYKEVVGGIEITVDHKPGELAKVRAELNEIFGVANVILF